MYTNLPIRHCHHRPEAVEDIIFLVVVVVAPSMVQHLARRSLIYS
jgi:hypothetical protein